MNDKARMKARMEEVEQQYHHLRQAGCYAEALELVTREAHIFPEYSQKVIYFWRMELACRLQDKDLALRLLAQAVDAGYWYDGLRDDPDFQLLAGDPEFERLVGMCEERRREAMRRAVPVIKILQPAGQPAPYPLLLALHGANANIEVNPWEAAAAHGWFVAVPQSSQQYSPDTYTWNDWEWAQREVADHYTRLCTETAVDPERVVLAGFSQGAGLATWMVLSGQIPARGLVLVGPFLPDVAALVPLLEQNDPSGLRVYLVAGQKDRYCLGIARQLAELLPKYGVECRLDVYPDMEHRFPQDFEHKLPQALNFVLDH